MEETYIMRYERKFIEAGVKEANEKLTEEIISIIKKMDADGVSPDFILKYFGKLL